jgi:predicted AAA+ superfamily ATPase
MDLKQLIIDQREELFETMGGKKLITREFQAEAANFGTSGLIKVVTGIRRAGKSVFLYQFLKDREFAYLNFDDDRLGNVEADDILKSFYEIYGRNLKTIFFDEIQNLPQWELFINRLKRLGFSLFITGSNAKLLSRELATHLTGRHLVLEIYPFSFREYLRVRGVDINLKTSKEKYLLRHEFDEFVRQGGFPEVAAEGENPGIYLKALYRQIIESDIIIRRKIAYEKTFKELASFLIHNTSSLISYNKIKKQFNFKSDHTVKNYISYLNEAYLIISIDRFSPKPVEIEKSPKKVYAIDTGLVNNLSGRISANIGKLYENIVAIELKRRQSLEQGMEVYYYKSAQNYEVDFVVKHDLAVTRLIQVSYTVADVGTKEREIRSLLHAAKDLRCNDLLIITGDYEAVEEAEWFGMKGRIVFLPLFKWLLI